MRYEVKVYMYLNVLCVSDNVVTVDIKYIVQGHL